MKKVREGNVGRHGFKTMESPQEMGFMCADIRTTCIEGNAYDVEGASIVPGQPHKDGLRLDVLAKLDNLGLSETKLCLIDGHDV